ncbi:hypothetical protein K437DRAFT_152418 [Tilletiaria anomala UBC 951]|uniref:Transmembrane protein n=1 Tax=Tilletiaria anomala (strain ATCC 24038 / CBS 436.72 / UBC 951) TaxID=1037660 RepID=A0A066VNX4_TILAU|nr:uncharacterized protein K437DRAFT_152418 [Tilletiaria anomala UBC 951]KDN43422.1 hypothetical protein K437DRAFT_152418 [Tilletiaria anomala UBC 951]
MSSKPAIIQAPTAAGSSLSGVPLGNIPLGQGFYVPADPIEQYHQIDIFRFIILAACGALIWEHIVTIHEEIYRWKQLFSGRPTWVGTLVLISRYSIWGSAISTFWFFFPPENVVNCQASITIIFAFMAITYICLANIFILRLRALWGGSGPQYLVPVLYAMMFVVSGCWIGSVAGFHGQAIPPMLQVRHGPVCMPAPAPYWRVLGWTAAAIFDVVLYVLTLIKVQQLRHFAALQDNASIKTLRRFVFNSSTAYFLVSFSCNISCIFILSFYRNMILQNIPILVSAIMNAIIACRVVFHSDLFSDGKTGLLVIDPLRRSMSSRRRDRVVGRMTTADMLQAQRGVRGVPVVVYTGAVAVDDNPPAFRDYEAKISPPSIVSSPDADQPGGFDHRAQQFGSLSRPYSSQSFSSGIRRTLSASGSLHGVHMPLQQQSSGSAQIAIKRQHSASSWVGAAVSSNERQSSASSFERLLQHTPRQLKRGRSPSVTRTITPTPEMTREIIIAVSSDHIGSASANGHADTASGSAGHAAPPVSGIRAGTPDSQQHGGKKYIPMGQFHQHGR